MSDESSGGCLDQVDKFLLVGALLFYIATLAFIPIFVVLTLFMVLVDNDSPAAEWGPRLLGIIAWGMLLVAFLLLAWFILNN